MAEGREENVLAWNVPNLITVWLMIALLWAALGIGSHLLFRKHVKGGGISSDPNGNVVTV